MASVKPERIADVIGGIYDAAYDSTNWLRTIEQLRGLFHGSKACFCKVGPDPRPDDAITTDFDPALNRHYAETQSEHRVVAERIGSVPVGAVYSDHALMGTEFLRGSRLWNEWMAPQDMYGGIACRLLASGQHFWLFDVQRGRTQTAFEAQDVKLLRMLTPHLTRAASFGASFQESQARLSALPDLLLGIFFVDPGLRIVSMNAAAEALIARPGGALCVKAGILSASGRQGEAGLRSLVVDACIVRDGIAAGPGGDILIRGGHDVRNRSDVLLSIGPAQHAEPFGLPGARHAVIFAREMTLALPDGFEDHVRGLFDLSPSEARIAAALAGGMALKETAIQQGIRFSTARSYLDIIFRKTGTRQQSQLVALLKSAQPVIRRP